MKKIVGIFVAFLTLTAFAGNGFLGLTLETIHNTGEGAEDNGVFIASVFPNSGASEAGLEEGDQITEINGHAIALYKDLEEAMAGLAIGDTASVTVIRNGKEMQTLVTLGERPEPSRKWAFEFASERTFLGVSTEELSGQLAAFFKVETGLLVKEVEAESPAEQAGLLAGDVILAIDGQPLKRNAELLKAVTSKKEKEEVTLSVKRDRKNLEITATLGKASHHGMNKFSTAPYVMGLNELNSIQDIEGLENLPQILEGLNFNIEMPEFSGNLSEMMGPEFKEKLEKEMEALRKQLKELENENRELIKKAPKDKGQLH